MGWRQVLRGVRSMETAHCPHQRTVWCQNSLPWEQHILWLHYSQTVCRPWFDISLPLPWLVFSLHFPFHNLAHFYPEEERNMLPRNVDVRPHGLITLTATIQLTAESWLMANIFKPIRLCAVCRESSMGHSNRIWAHIKKKCTVSYNGKKGSHR